MGAAEQVQQLLACVAERMIKASKSLIFWHRSAGDKPYDSSTWP